MNIQELEDKHGDIPLEPLNFDEFYYKKHTKLSVEFAISVLEEFQQIAEDRNFNSIAYDNMFYFKIQELKQYLNE